MCVSVHVCAWSGDCTGAVLGPSLSAGGLGSGAACLSGAVGSVHSAKTARPGLIFHGAGNRAPGRYGDIPQPEGAGVKRAYDSLVLGVFKTLKERDREKRRGV